MSTFQVENFSQNRNASFPVQLYLFSKLSAVGTGLLLTESSRRVHVGPHVWGLWILWDDLAYSLKLRSLAHVRNDIRSQGDWL